MNIFEYSFVQYLWSQIYSYIHSSKKNDICPKLGHTAPGGEIEGRFPTKSSESDVDELANSGQQEL